MTMPRLRSLASSLFALLAASPAILIFLQTRSLAQTAPAKSNGQPVASQEQPKTIVAALHPAAPPFDVLEYHFLPRFLERTPGNAATLYLKALALLAEHDGRLKEEAARKLDRWLAMPPAELPRKEVQEFLASYQAALGIVKMAARREHCDWDPPIREQPGVFAILLPEIQELRQIGLLLALQARLQIAEGHTAEAVDTLSTGFALARHTADCPFLVCGLVGLAISNIMLDEVDALIQSPHCPNLYWGLTALPDPLIDFRPAFEMERDSVFLEFPELRDVAHAQHTAGEWQTLLASFLRQWIRIGAELKGISDVADVGSVMKEAAMAVLGYPRAKAGLIAAGRDPKEVEAMSPPQVVLIYTALLYEKASDDQLKWINIPYWEVYDAMLKENKSLMVRLQAEEVVPLAQLVIPASLAVRNSIVRSRRRFAAVRAVEALRYFAEKHAGKFPAALADIKDVPLPVDPMTGRPFEYQRLADGRAVLEGKAPAGLPVATFGLRYELSIAEPKK